MKLRQLFQQPLSQDWFNGLKSASDRPVSANTIPSELQVRLSQPGLTGEEPKTGTTDGANKTQLPLPLSLDTTQRLIAEYQNNAQRTQQLVSNLETINFAPLVAQLRSAQFPKRWSKLRSYQAIQTYAEFLLNAALQPDVPLPAVSADMDQVWHVHILQTQKYTEDCITLFGHYLHHEAIAHPPQVKTEGACNISVSPNPVVAIAGPGACNIGVNANNANNANPAAVISGAGPCNIGLRRNSVAAVTGSGACKIDISSNPAVETVRAA